jgi:arginyl-tRNA synthetase
MQVLALIRQRFEAVLENWVDDAASLCRMITPARDPQHGDYQANIAMPLKSRLGKPPREIAELLVQNVELEDLCEPPEIAGPGFINLRLKTGAIQSEIANLIDDDRLGIALVESPRTYVIDYSAPNVAKPMHVGHIRSTVIGDAVARILRFLGHRVITDNHLGDWGTQFGMIIYGFKHFLDPIAFESQPVAELSRLYRTVQQLIAYQESISKREAAEQKLEAAKKRLDQLQATGGGDPGKLQKEVAASQKQVRTAEENLRSLTSKIEVVQQSTVLSELAGKHPELEKRCQLETARLHEGDAENLRLWNQFLPLSLREIESIYRRLDIEFDYSYGESFYHSMLGDLVEHLQASGLAVSSEGAVCLFLQGFDVPMIVRKSDGAFLYATTDLATIQYRMEQFEPDAILYVVDFRQSEHFSKLFAAARLMGYEAVELSHVSFGTVLGPDGKPFKTRSGAVVGLETLLDEAVERAYQAVCDPDRLKKAGLEMPEEERREIARVVGLGAIKYADLSHNRTSDYEFNTEKMVALEGNTSTYIQYMFARSQSILRKSGVDLDGPELRAAEIRLEHPAERSLAMQLLQLEDALIQSMADYTPNLLANYLYGVAKQFATFFEHCPVLSAETDAIRNSRLRLCHAAGLVLRQGLQLLGIGVVPRM